MVPSGRPAYETRQDSAPEKNTGFRAASERHGPQLPTFFVPISLGTRLGRFLRAISLIQLATLATRSSDTDVGNDSSAFKYRETYAAPW